MLADIKDFSFTYALALNGEPALKNINLQIKTGEFLTLCGASGSGKSTLLKNLKQAVAPAGARSGQISACGDGDTAIVFQNPETQIIMTDVISDLVFQMENRGMDPKLMKKRCAETVSFFGIEPLLHKSAAELSGGQKQIAALCAALMCEPKLLLLDEPVSQLDPLSAAAFLNAVHNLNREFGVTVVMAEHRLDECAVITDRVAFMEQGKIKFVGETKNALRFLYENGCEDFVPSLPRVSLAKYGEAALTPREFRESFNEKSPIHASVKNIMSSELHSKRIFQNPVRLNKDVTIPAPHSKVVRVKLKDITAGYGRKTSSPTATVLNRLDFSAGKGETVCLMGGNGSGKSTLLKVIAGVLKPFMGKVVTEGRMAYMPQNIRDFFLYDTVRANIQDMDAIKNLPDDLNIAHLLNRNPVDLSGGERQKCALAAMLSRKPDIMLLDEPTKGMDAYAKKTLGRVLKDFTANGGTAIIATHDIEFAAAWADNCAMLFDGEIAYGGNAREFFMGSKYYTTSVHKAMRHSNPLAMVPEDV